jgi:hypothetical protein
MTTKLSTLKYRFTQLFAASSIQQPELSRMYTSNDKRLREQFFETFAGHLQSSDINGDSNHFFNSLKHFFKHALDYTDDQLEIILSNGMVHTTCQFIKEARQFDSTLPTESIFQACRNVWIMNGLQYIFNRSTALTPSIFAYSLLYPYTDNFIDSPDITPEEKKHFAQRFASKIKGDSVVASTKMEAKVFTLIEMIETEWSRKAFPQVYQSLLKIHESQSKSAELITHADSLSFEKILSICISKGANSVLADGFLLLGEMTDQQAEFLYYYGAYLQLLDDLQDVQEDLTSGLKTAFSHTAANNTLDEICNKLYWMGNTVINMANQLNDSPNGFASLMQKSIELFILESVISSRSYFSKRYIKQFKSYSPFRLSFIKKKKKSIGSFQGQIFQQIEKQIGNIAYTDE